VLGWFCTEEVATNCYLVLLSCVFLKIMDVEEVPKFCFGLRKVVMGGIVHILIVEVIEHNHIVILYPFGKKEFDLFGWVEWGAVSAW